MIELIAICTAFAGIMWFINDIATRRAKDEMRQSHENWLKYQKQQLADDAQRDYMLWLVKRSGQTKEPR